MDGHTESHAGQFSVKFRNDFTYGLGSTSRGRDNVLGSTTAITPELKCQYLEVRNTMIFFSFEFFKYFSRRSIDGFLSSCDGVNGGHQAFNDTKVVVYDFSERSQAVGCA